MKIIEAYHSDGELISDECIDISGLQQDTKKAILQLVYLDNAVDVYNEALNKFTQGEDINSRDQISQQ